MDKSTHFPGTPSPPASVNSEQPNAARMYDWFLGGSANFAVDRDAARRILEVLPGNTFYIQNNRSFLGRVVRYLTAEAGIDQFLDLGSGVPTVGNVHEIAHRYNQDARTAYVDFEPIAVQHTRNLLGAEEERVTITQADIRDPDAVLSAPGVADLLDFDRPVGILAIGILPFLTDNAEALALLSRYRDAAPAGSYLGVSHIAPLSCSEEALDESLKVLSETPTPERSRNLDDLRAILPEGFSWVSPGIVPTVQWRADRDVTDEEIRASNCYAALGRKE